MKNLSKKHLKHLWNRYLFYSNYYNEEILKPEDLPIHQWIEEAYILMTKERFEADIDYFIDLVKNYPSLHSLRRIRNEKL